MEGPEAPLLMPPAGRANATRTIFGVRNIARLYADYKENSARAKSTMPTCVPSASVRTVNDKGSSVTVPASRTVAGGHGLLQPLQSLTARVVRWL
jgi:hypothetical protein